MFKNKFSLLLLACILLVACNDNDVPVDESTVYPVVISAKAFDYTAEGNGTTWSKGETIGVYMLKGGTDDIIPPYSNLRYYANNRTDQDYFLPGNNDSIPYFPATGEKMDIAAYYPQATVLADSLVSIHLIEDYSYASKLLFSRVSNLNKDSRKAVLALQPALTKLTFTFKVGYGMTEKDFKGLTVTLKGLPVSAYFNTTTGKVRLRDVTTDQDIKFTATENSSVATRAEGDKIFMTATGMVLPASTTAGYTVIVDLPAIQKNYVYKIKQGTDELKPSMDYIFDGKINNENMIITVQSSPIINWGQGGTIGGNGEEKK